MNKLYLLEPGFVEDTVLYELVPKEVGRFKQATADEVVKELNNRGVLRLVIDSAHPTIIERFKLHFLVKKILRRPPKQPKQETGK